MPLLVVKRNGVEEPFDREKIVAGHDQRVQEPTGDRRPRSTRSPMTSRRRCGPIRRRPIPSAEIGREVLERLRDLDEVAYLRFASVYKDFQELDDFERELGILLKKSPPKGTGLRRCRDSRSLGSIRSLPLPGRALTPDDAGLDLLVRTRISSLAPGERAAVATGHRGRDPRMGMRDSSMPVRAVLCKRGPRARERAGRHRLGLPRRGEGDRREPRSRGRRHPRSTGVRRSPSS